MNRRSHHPSTAGQPGSPADAALEELLSQLGDVGGPTSAQVTALDRALEPYLGAFASVAPGSDAPAIDTGGAAHHSLERGGTTTLGGGQAAAASHTGLVSGKLLGVLGSVVVAGAVLWGVTRLPEPDGDAGQRSLSGAEHRASVSSRPDTDIQNVNRATRSDSEVLPQQINIESAAAEVAHARAKPSRRSPRATIEDSKSVGDEQPPPSKRRSSDAPADWAQELQRLERVEAALKGGQIDAALAVLNQSEFAVLRLNARALEAAVLCAGTTRQRQRGATLARKMAASDRSAMLVRRLKDCMTRN